MQHWDESRHGVNAYEMQKEGNYAVTTYNYQIDYWNLKPPVSEYFIILGYKIFGFNLLGLRFFSAFAMLVCAAICFTFAYKKIGKIGALWIIVGFIITEPLLLYHCARTGDADSLFILFSTISIIGLLVNKENMRGMYVACFSFALAFLTKSFHAGITGLIIISYLIINRKNLKLNFKKIFLSIFWFLFPILIWGILRYGQDGITFFQKMFEVDVLKRTTNVVENHSGTIWYYIDYLLKYKSIIIFVTLICFVFNKEKGKKQEKVEKINDEIETKVKDKNIILLILSILIPLIAFTAVKTKITWYILCVYPPLIILSSYGAQYIYESKTAKKRIIFSILAFISIVVARKNFEEVNKLKIDNNVYSYSAFNILQRDQEYAGKTVYKYKEKWQQSELLATELAGDMICQNGGYNKWKYDKNSYIIVSAGDKQKITDLYDIVANNKNFFLLKHKLIE